MKHHGNPPAGMPPDVLPGTQMLLASAVQPPSDPDLTTGQDEQLTEQVACALAYLVQLDRQPLVQPQFTAGDRRYLAGPLIVGDPAWGADTPVWLSDAVQIARLGLLLAGEHEQASEEEAVAYLWPPAWPRRCTTTGRRSTSGLRHASWHAGARSARRNTSGRCSVRPYPGAPCAPIKRTICAAYSGTSGAAWNATPGHPMSLTPSHTKEHTHEHLVRHFD